jgi:hypothetical protein
MRKATLVIILIITWNSAYNQSFPSPEDFCAYFDNDSIYLTWQSPENKSFSNYSIYYFGLNNGLRIHLCSTTDTNYTIPAPTFMYNICFGLTAEYVDPPGVSDTAVCCITCLLALTLPSIFDFESGLYVCGLVANILEGSDNWVLYDSIFYSPQHSAAFISDTNNFKSALTTAPFAIMPTQIPKLSFKCKIPQTGDYSDTLKLYYLTDGSWIQYSDPIYSIDDWQLHTYSLESLPSFSRFAFEATSGGGSGVFLDDVVFEDELVNIQKQGINKPFMEIMPNPATSTLTLNLVIEEDTKFSATIFSIDGKPVKSNINQVLIPGNHKINIDICDLDAGIYFISANLNNNILTKKVLIY